MEKNYSREFIKNISGNEISTEKQKELQELDRIAKMLVRRDFELSQVRQKREKEVQEFKKKTEELEKTRAALINILQDVDDAREKAEGEKNKTLAIINNFTDGLLVFDKENKLSLVNSHAEIFFNIKKQEVIGKSISELKVFSTKFKMLVELIGGKIKNIFRKELKIRENLVLEVSTISAIAGGEERVGTLVVLHDITRDKLVEKLKSEFVSLSAHQLRTPLSAIKWSISILRESVKEGEALVLIEKISQANERMIGLINDLLNVTRIEEGKYIYKTELHDIRKIVRTRIEAVEDTVKKKNIEMKFEAPESMPKVITDKEKISICIQNLIENAVKYTNPKGRISILLKYDEYGKEILFSIKDSGIGIPEEEHKRVFTKFFRSTNAMREETEGSGLGLYIAKNIIEAHGGKIWFGSNEKEGTNFFFTLPVVN